MLPSTQCILIGDCGVGKTTLLKNATHQPLPRLPTIGVDMISYTSETFRLQCWDTSGQPRFKHVVQMFVQNCTIVVYVFAATSEESFQSILHTHARLHHQDKTFVAICTKTKVPGANSQYCELLQQQYPDIHLIVSDPMTPTLVMEEIIALVPIAVAPASQECCTIV